MEQGDEPVMPEAQPAPVGARLAQTREAAGMDLAEVAARTRIPQRHLAAIEAGDFAALPSRTYAVGFTRTYARLLGLDEHEIVDEVRRELDSGANTGMARFDRFEPGDPARVPSRRLAWLSALAVVLVVAGGFAFYQSYFSPGMGPAPLTDAPKATTAATRAAPAASAPAAAPTGPVVLTSLADGSWIKITDSAGKRLFEGQLAKGQAFTVPADAAGPKAWTGRPDLFAVSVGGRPVAPLGTEPKIVRDVAIDAASLEARPAAPAPASTSAVPAATPAAPVPTPAPPAT